MRKRETPIVPNGSADNVKSVTLWISTDISEYCLLIVDNFAARTRSVPGPIAKGDIIIKKSSV